MTRDVYDELYFTENYSREIGEKRDRMLRDSANSRKNAADMPNATTVVFMEDTPDGGVTVTTGDFVAFFNKRCGYDRVGEFRRTMAKARENDDLNRAKEQRIAEMKARNTKKERTQPQARRPRMARFSFVKAVFGLMMVLALSILVGTSLMLEQSKTELASLEAEVSGMQLEYVTEQQAATYTCAAEDCSFDGEDSVEVYAVEDQPFVMTELLSAFADLWRS